MYCDQRSQYIRPKSKKNSFRGNYVRKHGSHKKDHSVSMGPRILKGIVLKIRQNYPCAAASVAVTPAEERTNALFMRQSV